MKLKGIMVLEFKDEATGAVETVTEENMVTEAVNDTLGLNPMGVFYSEKELGDVLAWNNVLLPICPNMVGGGASCSSRKRWRRMRRISMRVQTTCRWRMPQIM